MSDMVCEHGRLARVCRECELEMELSGKAAELSALREQLKLLQDGHPCVVLRLAEYERFTKERDELREQLEAARAERDNALNACRLAAEHNSSAMARIDILARRLREAERDAGRYRWLRDERDDAHSIFWQYVATYYGHDDVRRTADEVDAAIDAARAQEKQ